MTKSVRVAIGCLLIAAASCSSDRQRSDGEYSSEDHGYTMMDSSRENVYSDTLVNIHGDFDGNGSSERARSLPPYSYPPDGDCKLCSVRVVFDGGIATLRYPWAATDLALFNVGDITGDRADELLTIDAWTRSCWGRQALFSYERGGWRCLLTGSMYRCKLRNTVHRNEKGQYVMEEDIIDPDTLAVAERVIPTK